MIVTAEQAAALPGPFVVDGDKYIHPIPGGWMHDRRPPKVWADADQPCDNPQCDDGHRSEQWMEDNEPMGDGWQGMPPPECPVCHGTGRTVVELVLDYGDGSGELKPLGLFTIEMETLRHLAGTPSGRYTVTATKVEI